MLSPLLNKSKPPLHPSVQPTSTSPRAVSEHVRASKRGFRASSSSQGSSARRLEGAILHLPVAQLQSPRAQQDESSEKRRAAFVVLALPRDSSISSGTYHFIRVLRSADLDPEQLLPILILIQSEDQLSTRFKRQAQAWMGTL
jgi:hypothetical protein